uniref:TonB_dep_Rec domain-containing protein n=1 Tax=Steinernema glaseri TaxID=37863 RepID=A0A1I7YTX6_9BILA
MTDERSSMFFPGLYIAGDKAALRPQTVPDIHLPGQTAHFSGKTAMNPFTHAVAATYTEDLVDSWGAGFAVNGVNNYGLDVRRNFDEYANMKYDRNDGSYQPFVLGFAVGAEFDGLGIDQKILAPTPFSPKKKIKEFGGSLNIPILGVNELFDLDGHIMTKGNGGGIFGSHIDFPLTLADPHERFPASITYLNYMADNLMHYGHVVPNVNLFGISRDKIMERLLLNKANPTMVG